MLRSQEDKSHGDSSQNSEAGAAFPLLSFVSLTTDTVDTVGRLVGTPPQVTDHGENKEAQHTAPTQNKTQCPVSTLHWHCGWEKQGYGVMRKANQSQIQKTDEGRPGAGTSAEGNL